MSTAASRPARAGTRRASSSRLEASSRNSTKIEGEVCASVLDFRLGQRRPAVDAPVDGLLALVDQASLHALAERPRDGRLVAEVHRQVRVLPVAEHAQPLELLGHHADEPLGVGAAGAAKVRRRHLPLLRPELAVDLQLDRQAVAVVPRDVRRVVAGHRAGLDDEVLEDLVERGAQVDLPVGVGRPVVQHVLRRAGPPLRGAAGRGRSSPIPRWFPARPSAGWPSSETRCEAGSAWLSSRA